MDLDKTFLSITIGIAWNPTSAEVSLQGLTLFLWGKSGMSKNITVKFSQCLNIYFAISKLQLRWGNEQKQHTWLWAIKLWVELQIIIPVLGTMCSKCRYFTSYFCEIKSFFLNLHASHCLVCYRRVWENSFEDVLCTIKLTYWHWI